MSRPKSSVLVFTPTPLLTITIEHGADESSPEIHFHAGGQGHWVARMVATLGLQVTLCGPFGGDSGNVLKALIEAEGIVVRKIQTGGANGSYIHDRRSGERVVVAETAGEDLSRHEIDDLYNAALVSGITAGVAILTGSAYPGLIPNSVYTRLAGDLRSNGCRVVADLSGETLMAALEGGIDMLKLSHEEMIAGGIATSNEVEDLLPGIETLRSAGAESVVVTRAADPALAWVDGTLYEIKAPSLAANEFRGSGDSFTAGLAVGIARNSKPEEMFQVAASAGALNVTRHGLGTGQRDDIMKFAQYVTVNLLEEASKKKKGS